MIRVMFSVPPTGGDFLFGRHSLHSGNRPASFILRRSARSWMPTIVAKADKLDELNRNYAQTPLKGPVFLNSVPKCGTHLLRNIVRMFVPVEQQYHKTFIQHAVLGQHMAAFNPATPMLSWGHLFFSDASAIVLHETARSCLFATPMTGSSRARASSCPTRFRARSNT